MNSALFRWLILTVAVWAAASVVPGISYDGAPSLVIAALILGILNTFVKPVIQVLSIPLIAATLGLFLLLINAFLLRLAGWLVTGFHVDGFGSALGGSLVISIVNLFLGRRSRGGVAIHQARTFYSDGRRPPPPGQGPIIDV